MVGLITAMKDTSLEETFPALMQMTDKKHKLCPLFLLKWKDKQVIHFPIDISKEQISGRSLYDWVRYHMIKSPDLKNEQSQIESLRYALTANEKKRLNEIQIQIRHEQDELKTI